MRRIPVKIALPLLLGLSSLVAVACGEENPPPSDEGGSGNDIGDGSGGQPNDGGGGGANDGSGGATDGGGSGGTNGEGGEGGEVTGGGSGGSPPIIVEEPELPACDEPDGEIDGGVLDGEPCWGTGVTCKGTDTEQFLQQCSGTCIEHFDNEARIVGFDGTLPPL
jgi:hypothetical protein